jgi:dihydrofolate reductase
LPSPFPKGNIAEAITALKQQPGQNIVVSGSGRLVQSLMQFGLVDEYSLLVYPIILGAGKRFFSVRTLPRISQEPGRWSV